MRALPVLLLLAVAGTACTNDSLCPSLVPADGGSCTPPTGSILACEYGGNANTACTTFAECATTNASSPLYWMVTTPDPSCGTQPTQCAAAFGAMEGASCSDFTVSCDYTDGRCGCVRCESDGGVGGFWHCRNWSDVGPGCPTPRPRLGTACTTEGVHCDYNQCCGGPSLGPPMECSHGYWTEYVDTGCACAIQQCP